MTEPSDATIPPGAARRSEATTATTAKTAKTDGPPDRAEPPRRAPSSAAEVAALVGGRLEGPGETPVRGINTLDAACDGDVTFAADEAHARRIEESKARVIVISEGLRTDLAVPDGGTVSGAAGRSLVRVRDAEFAIIALLESFAPAPIGPGPGVHPSAVVAEDAVIGAGARIGAFASVGARARLGAGVTLHDGARVMAGCEIGDGCVIHANAVVRERCRIGRRVVLHASAVIGSDGFGYRPSPDGRGLVRVPHVGIVRIEDDVEIGAGTCVDRAKFGETVIGAGTKIDNLCQIGHNVRFGRACVMAGLSGVAGSVTIGDGTRIGGQVGISDHVRVGRGVTLAATSAVMNDVPDGATWGGVPAQDVRMALREAAAIRRLPEWSRRLRHLLEGDPRQA